MSNTLPKSVSEVKSKIQALSNFSDLEPAYYAPENGAAHIVARDIKNKEMKATQLRKFFGHIKKIEAETKGMDKSEKIESSKLYLILPELAYALGRNLISKEFYELMKISIQAGKIQTVADFKEFVSFLSAVLAYHKMIGGK